MAKVKSGDVVKVHYTGKIKDGEVFDSSVEREPFQIEIGAGTVIPGFENAIVGLEVGDTVTVDISPDEGYGDHHEGMVKEQNILDESGNRLIPEGAAPGLSLQGTGPMGEPVNATILEVTDTTVKLDFNHILAGKDLVFDIELIENIPSENTVEDISEVTEDNSEITESNDKSNSQS